MIDKQDGLDRRTTPRTPAEMPVRIRLGDDFIHASTLDLGPNGLGLRCARHIAVGTEIEVQFGLSEDGGSLLTMKAKVRHSSAVKMGVQFVNVMPSDHARIMDLIRRLTAQKIG